MSNIFSKIKQMDQQDLFKKTGVRKIKANGVNISIIISMTIIVILCTLIIKVILSIDFKTLLLAAGENLDTDSQGHTNILVIGTGTDDHDGAHLTDTLIVTSLDQETERASMISIPRDMHIEDDLLPTPRINEIFFYAKDHFGSEKEGLEYLIEKVEELSGLDIQYYVRIDFKAFEEIIDALGGIDINVPESIYDPFYPKEGTLYYETFQVPAGQQHMTGETALKYARSRKTTSDFSRSARQQLIIYAIKEKALQTNFILNKDKITDLLSSINDNIQTNISIREMLTLGGLAENFSRDKINSIQIHDDPVQCGGFLYAPSIELYGGAFVLTPAGGAEYITKFFNLIANNQEAFSENLKIQTLNGTPRSGIAAENKQVFQRYCLDITRFGNARSQSIEQTTIYYHMLPLPKEKPEDVTEYYIPKTVELLQEFIPEATASTEFPQEYIDQGYEKSSDIILEIGSDYVNSDHYLEDSFYPLYNIIYAEPVEDAEATAEASS
jgi:LCP family protein required for cell wall assembly